MGVFRFPKSLTTFAHHPQDILGFAASIKHLKEKFASGKLPVENEETKVFCPQLWSSSVFSDATAVAQDLVKHGGVRKFYRDTLSIAKTFRGEDQLLFMQMTQEEALRLVCKQYGIELTDIGNSQRTGNYSMTYEDVFDAARKISTSGILFLPYHSFVPGATYAIMHASQNSDLISKSTVVFSDRLGEIIGKSSKVAGMALHKSIEDAALDLVLSLDPPPSNLGELTRSLSSPHMVLYEVDSEKFTNFDPRKELNLYLRDPSPSSTAELTKKDDLREKPLTQESQIKER